MIKYRVPATSANLGIGFDCLGLAINLYNYFEIETSDKDNLVGFECADEENLFLKAYKETCEKLGLSNKNVSVKIIDEVPMSRGLGSSSVLIVGGIYGAYYLNGLEIDKEEIQKLATKIEGHPDNVTPAIYGGLCCSRNEIISKFDVSDKWRFYVLIPNYEVKTSEARKVIKREINLSDAVNNISSALIGIDGLVNFDEKKLSLLNTDTLHEPYRKTLIKDYEECKKLAYEQGASAFLISGSGSTMLAITSKELNINVEGINFKEVKVDREGVKCL